MTIQRQTDGYPTPRGEMIVLPLTPDHNKSDKPPVEDGESSTMAAKVQQARLKERLLKVRHSRENEIDRPTRAVAEKYLTPISLDESDVGDISDKHHDGLVISIPVGNCMIKRVLVNNGSSTKVMMIDALKEMGRNPDTDVIKKSTVLIGFSCEEKTTFGEVTLPVYAQGVNQQALVHVMKAIPSTYHQTIKFPTRWGVQEIKGDQQESKECYKAALKPSATNKSSL
ncbi:uncharacterized protein [Spinacia oleracea]|uniref:Uncharacterized protein n=1 Tax=Spinacia oleracea TaxID=3562 RepID=A0ABM3RHP8_SPIOL|nr:uncharacterized protein LOC130469711 [Spinacia oleracea]